MPRIANLASGLLAAQLVQCVISAGWAVAPPPPEAFGSMPAESDAVLSPDGHWLAWLDRKEAKPRVIMLDVPGRKVHRIRAVPERVKLRNLVWNDNETLLIVLSETRESKVSDEASREYFRTIAHDVSGGDGRMLPINPMAGYGPNKHDAMLAYLVASQVSKPHTVIMSTAYPCRCLWEVDTRTGKGNIARHGNEFTPAWVG